MVVFFKVTELFTQNEKKKTNTSCGDKLQDSIKKIGTLFSKSHSRNMYILLFLQFSSMMGQVNLLTFKVSKEKHFRSSMKNFFCRFHVMRLWVPPLWVMMNNFRVFVRQYYPKDEFITMCEMLYPRIQKIDHTYCNYTLVMFKKYSCLTPPF